MLAVHVRGFGQHMPSMRIVQTAQNCPSFPHASSAEPAWQLPDPSTQPLEEGDYFLYNRLEADGGSDDEARIVERLSQDEIVGALAEVPHDFRDVIVLVDIGDFTYQDAAQILDIPIGTVMSRLHRGRRILKKELAEASLGESG